MKAIMVMFDSLNRHMLPPYGGDWVDAPNFQRLAQRSIQFDNCWIGSMPCMPARRELHTGRYNFLHRGWGPIEPFDDSMPQILKENGIHAHLASDHFHYLQDGGGSYHPRYTTWEFARGQEGDPWKGEIREPVRPERVIGAGKGSGSRQDWINRKHMPTPAEHSQTRTFDMGLEFLQANHEADRWFLQIEAFDPHQPFFTHQCYKDRYAHHYDEYTGPHFDWPHSGKVTETPEQVAHLRFEYAALVSMCDEQLGRVLDAMDEFDLWQDTMLIVNTDHGCLLGEHDWWGKVKMPFYNEVSHVPLFIWDPHCGKHGERNDALVQMIDIAPTLLDYFEQPIPGDMLGRPLRETMARGSHVREACLFGVFGMHVNCTDGRYVYMRAPVHQDNEPLYQYTLMPTHMRERFSPQELQDIQLHAPFSFTKGCRTMKIRSPGPAEIRQLAGLHLLFDNVTDPQQLKPIYAPDIEQRMIAHLLRLMKEHDAPAEQYTRLGLTNGDGAPDALPGG